MSETGPLSSLTHETTNFTFLHNLSSREARKLHESVWAVNNRIAGDLSIAQHKVGVCVKEEKKEEKKKNEKCEI